MPQSDFREQLRTLMAAPYAMLQIMTHEEERALGVVDALAREADRPLWVWSPTRGFHGQQGPPDLFAACDSIEEAQVAGVFVFLDADGLLEDLVLRRRLRELEVPCARANKTLVFISPRAIDYDALQKEITTLTMPLPGQQEIHALCLQIFDQAQESPGDIRALVSGALGLTSKEAMRAFYRVKIARSEAAQSADFDLETSILEEKRRLIGSNDALEFHALKEGVGDIGGLGDLKQWLAQREQAFTQRARDFGLPAPKGLLLVGIQGCGKSLTAKAVARIWGLPLLRLDLGRIFDGRRSPEETMRVALQTSEALSPCVLWIDEIEKGFANDSEGRARRVLGSLLTWLQEKSSPVFLVATANQVDALPPELLRKGRFDEIFFVDLPDEEDRKAILKIHLSKRSREVSDERLQEIAARCEHFSGSELEQVVVSGLYMAFAEDRELSGDDLMYAARTTVPLYKTYEEQIKALREWAEHRARPAASKRRVLDFFRKG